MEQREVEEKVLDIYKKQLNREEVQLDEKFDLSSLETLNILAQIERTFFVEVDDDLVFHGIFSDIKELSKYIVEHLEEE